MVVEHKQVGPIIHGCRGVALHDATAHLPAVSVVVGVEDAERQPLLAGVVGVCLQLVEGSIEGTDDKGALRYPINAPRFLAAVGDEVLELYATTLGRAMLLERLVQIVA